MILLLIGKFVKVAHGFSLRTKVQLIFGCGLFIDKDINIVDAPEMWLILCAAYIREFTVNESWVVRNKNK